MSKTFYLDLGFATKQPQILLRERRVRVTEAELDILLHRIGHEEGGLNPTARELMDYLDGRGLFASYVDLAARHEDVQRLFDAVADEARFAHDCPTIGQRIVDEGEEVLFKAYSKRTVIA